jgi:hypothetical protein
MNPFRVEAKIRDLADKAASDFLSPLAEKTASPEHVSKNAGQILVQSGNDLSHVVSKIASDENLNPHEVARVCEEANKEVFSRLYKLCDDKTTEFKVADANTVLSGLNRPYAGPGDLFLPVEHPKMGNVTIKTAAIKPEESQNWARTALYPNEGQKLVMSLEQEKIANESFSELTLEAEAARHQAAMDFTKMSRDLVLEGGRTPSQLYAMVKEARPGSAPHEKAARELLALVSLVTNSKFPEGAEDVVKYAKALIGTSETGGGEQPSDDLRHVTQEQYEFWTKSPGQPTEEFIGGTSSAGEPVNVINGRHKLFVTLDTMVDQTNKENWYGKGLLFSGDRVRSIARNVVNWKPKTENVLL